MDNKKCIVLVRESTTRQEIESQTEETYKAALDSGYSPDDIIVIGQAGSSAIKLNQKYVEDMERLLHLMKTDNSIKEVFVWAIDRIGRKLKYIGEISDIVYERKIQLTVLKPHMKLLLPNGEKDPATALAFSMYAEMAVLEMEHKKERFARIKRHYAEIGKFSGGDKITFGYKLDDNGFFVPLDEEVAFIKMIYEMFTSGKYSVAKLAVELDKLGYTKRGEKITQRWVSRILTNTAYIGRAKYYNYLSKEIRYRNYPTILSKELFDKVQTVLASNNRNIGKEQKHYFFGNRLIKCSYCGYSFSPSGGSYKCGSYMSAYAQSLPTKAVCTNTLSIRIKYMDGLLWYYAIQKHFDFLLDDKTKAINQYQQTISTNLQKLSTESTKMAEFDSERGRIDDVYISGRLSKDKYQIKLNEVDDKAAKVKDEMLSLKEENQRLQTLIDELVNIGTDEKQLIALVEKTQRLDNEKEMSDIVHKYVKQVTIRKGEYENKQCFIITISFIDGDVKEVYYFSRLTKCKFFTLSSTGKLNAEPIEYIERKVGKDGTKAVTSAVDTYNTKHKATAEQFSKMPLVQKLVQKLFAKDFNEIAEVLKQKYNL